MRRLVVGVVVVIGLAAGAWYGLYVLSAGALRGCPLALMEGTLVRVDDTLGVQPDAAPAPEVIRWPPGYSVGDDDGRLGLWHLFSVVGHEGDRVSMGGGYGTDEVFQACGPVDVEVVPSLEPEPLAPAGSVGPEG